MERKKFKINLENRDTAKQEGKAETDLEGEDFYRSTPVVTNYYFQYRHGR